MRSLWFLLILASAWPARALAMFELAADGNVGVRTLKVALAETPGGSRWSAAAQLEGKAKHIALLYLVPGSLSEAQVELEPVLQALDRQTAPQIKELSAADPCAEAGPVESIRILSEGWTAASGPFRVERLTPRTPAELETWLAAAQVKLPAEAIARAVRHAASGGALIAFAGAWTTPERSGWTPTLRLDFGKPEWTLPLGSVAAAAPVGRTLRATVFTTSQGAAGWVPQDRRVIDLPGGFNIPELALEDGPDLLRLLADQVIRRERTPIVLRLATLKEAQAPGAGLSATGRYELQLGRRVGNYLLSLGPDPSVLAYRAEWSCHRIWRQAMKCPLAQPYRVGATLQLQADLRTYATLTGQRLPEVNARSERRGYGPPP